MNEVLQRLSVELAMDTADFATGSTDAQRRIGGLRDAITGLGDKWMETGRKLSMQVSLPITGALAGVVAVAGNFEAAMIRVGISSQGSAEQMESMRKRAIQLGADTVFSASEAADAMDMLAKNGLDATQILNGAADAAVNLATAAGSDLAPAADAITDVMQQFKITASELPMVVDQITGAVNESKLDFSDFALAIGQAGGVAGSSGVEFDDFNAVLAGTSSLFASGSDAGTSFKTFLTSLPGKSKPARVAIEQFGLEFFDAAGNMRSMADIAQTLQDGLSGLDEKARQNALQDIFGRDAMRTAIGLMDLGAEGLEGVKTRIEETDAAAQAATRMEGFTGQLENLQGAMESLAIAIADTGLLTAITSIITKLADFVTRLSETNPWVLKVAVGIGVLAAAMGPLMLVMGTLAAVVLPLFAARFGPIGLAISAFINPLGTAISLLGQFVARIAGMAILKSIGAMLLRFAGPVGLIASLGILIYQNWDRISAVFADFWERAKEALGPPLQELLATITSAFEELWSGPMGDGIRTAIEWVKQFGAAASEIFGDVLIAVLGVALDAVIIVFENIGDVIRGINALLNGDFRGAWEASVSVVRRMFGPLADFVIGVVSRMVTGIQTWVVGRLNAIWDTVTNKIQEVKDGFFNLYDAVVGNSYVPDMVDGIRDHMARLDAVMVKPAKAATTAVSESMRDMARDTQALLNRLFPEIRRAMEYQEDLATLAGSSLSDSQQREARYRLGVELGGGANDNGIDVGAGNIENIGPTLEELRRAARLTGQDIEATNVRIVESFKDMAQKTVQTVQNLADAIKGGGFLDIIAGVIDLGLQLGSIGAFGKGFAKKVNNLPGYANGTNFAPGGLAVVGERGPELVNLPRGSQVIPNHELGGMGQMQIEVVANNNGFGAIMRNTAGEVVAEAGPSLMQGGAMVAQRNMGRRQTRRVG